jgi:beta-fructofuranosidase
VQRGLYARDAAENRGLDHHFPRYHLRPPTGFVNDPNGPIRLGDTWHLYFQYTPDTAQRDAVVWGHATSADLVSWRLHPPALVPHPHGLDRDGCWSGNTVASGGDVVAFYSGYRQDRPYQSVLAAVSTDGGRSYGEPWTAAPDPEPSEDILFYRDPFVWRDGDAWYMAVGAGDRSGEPAVRLYQSADLRTWRFLGPLVRGAEVDAGGLDLGEMWECPQVLSLGTQTAVLVGTWSPGNGIGEVLALVGTATDNRLAGPTATRLDQGPNFYAASALRDGPEGPLVWGWITEGRSSEWAAEADWAGVISLPRLVRPAAGNRLTVTPVAAVASLRHRRHPQSVAGDTSVAYDDLSAQFELALDLRRRTDRAAPTRVSLSFREDEHLDIVIDWRSRDITIDRTSASADPRAHQDVLAFTEPALIDGSLSLRLFVDGSVGELFTGTGRSFTFRFYATTPPPWGLRVTGVHRADTVDVWRLRVANPVATP